MTTAQPSGVRDEPSSSAAPGHVDGPNRTVSVIVNVVTAYQRLHLRLEQDTLTIDAPVAWLGVVPHGRRVIVLARREIAAAFLAPAVFPSRLAVAIGFAGLPRLAELPVAVDVACWVAAALFLLLSVVASIRIETSDGRHHVIPVCWFARRAVLPLLSDLTEDTP